MVVELLGLPVGLSLKRLRWAMPAPDTLDRLLAPMPGNALALLGPAAELAWTADVLSWPVLATPAALAHPEAMVMLARVAMATSSKTLGQPAEAPLMEALPLAVEPAGVLGWLRHHKSKPVLNFFPYQMQKPPEFCWQNALYTKLETKAPVTREDLPRKRDGSEAQQASAIIPQHLGSSAQLSLISRNHLLSA
ncbi:UNVERIFIED_CONTAM: hypothetical protein K2H54_041742 [Gekko kuhli]